jgi:TIGR03643 family protein
MEVKNSLSKSDIDRIIEMAWEDRTTFDAIFEQFKLNEQHVKELMRSHLKPSSYKLWRKRVQGRKTKHLSKRDFKVGRHKSYDHNKIK